MFQIVRKFTENGQEKSEVMGIGDQSTLDHMNKETVKHPKYAGSVFEKGEQVGKKKEKSEKPEKEDEKKEENK